MNDAHTNVSHLQEGQQTSPQKELFFAWTRKYQEVGENKKDFKEKKEVRWQRSL